MTEKKRILIVEDHTLLRAGLSALLSRDADLEIVGEADNGRDAVRSVSAVSPHLVLMDLSMPGSNGIEAIHDIKKRYPEVRVLVLTLHKSDEYIQESLRAGAATFSRTPRTTNCAWPCAAS
jgi:DNA-binding NarL/FixJ family response regulator